MSSRVASAYIEIGVAADGIASGINKAKEQVTGGVQGVTGAIGGIGLGAMGMFAGLAAGVASFVSGAMEAESTAARFGFMMEEMGPRIGFTTDQLGGMASSMAELTNQSTGAARGVMSTLAMMQQVNGDSFRLATQYALQFAQTGLTSVDQAAHSLGLALENPARGIRMLRSLGVTFNDTQTHTIQQMQQMGDVAGAQGIILARIGQVIPGLSAAMAGTTTAHLAALERNLKEIGKSIGLAVLPVLAAVADAGLWVANTIKSAWGALPQPFKEVGNAGLLAVAALVSWRQVLPLFSVLAGLLSPVGNAIKGIYSVGSQLVPTLYSMASGLVLMASATVSNVAAWIAQTTLMGVAIIKGVFWGSVMAVVTVAMWSYSAAIWVVNVAKAAYIAVMNISSLATAAFAVVATIATGGLYLLGVAALFAGGLIVGVFVAAIVLALSPLIAFAGALASIVAVIGGLGALAGVGQVIAFLAAMVSAFRDPDLGRPMKESLLAVWAIVKQIGQAFMTAFGAFNTGGWQELRVFAQTTFLAITGWITANGAVFISWGYFIGQIARTSLNLLLDAWNFVMRTIGSGLGWLVGQTSVSWGSVLSTISTVLNYVSVLMQNLNVVWDIIVLGFQYAWARITTGATWQTWLIQAKMVFNEIKDYLVEAFYSAWSMVRDTFIRIMPFLKAAALDMLAGIVGAMANGPFAEMLGLTNGLRQQAESLRLDARMARSADGADRMGAERQIGENAASDEEARANRAQAAAAALLDLQRQLADAQAQGETPEVIRLRAQLAARIANISALVEMNRLRGQNAGGKDGNTGGGGGNNPPSNILVEFKQSGLVDMWKQAQQSMTGKLESLAREHIAVANMQVERQDRGNNLLEQVNAALGQPRPAVAG